MTDATENTAKIQELYALYGSDPAAGFETFMELLADSVYLESLGNGAPGIEFTRCRRTKDDVRKYLEELFGDWEMIHYTPGDFIADGDHVDMDGRTSWRNRKTGKVLNTAKIDVFRFKDGKVVGFKEYYDTHALREAAS